MHSQEKTDRANIFLHEDTYMDSLQDSLIVNLFPLCVDISFNRTAPSRCRVIDCLRSDSLIHQKICI